MSQPLNRGQKLEGKVAIIMGGASGIGEATARLFAVHGTRMVIIGDIQDSLGQQVAESIGTHKCIYMRCDVTDEDQVEKLIESTVRKFGQLDVMFSNAGVISSSDQDILNLDFSQYDRLQAVNARGMAVCVKHAARAMVETRVRGSIVCTASNLATAGCTGSVWTDYCMSKHAVLGLLRSASIKLGEHGIRVNCVSPAAVATPLACKALKMEAHDVEKVYEEHALLKGVALRTSHVAEAVLFLASDDSEVITGHDLPVDGGFRVKKF